jgi:hypothetical protein
MMPTAGITPKLTARFGARNVCVAGLVLADQAKGSFALAIRAGGPIRASASSAFVDGLHIGLLCAAGSALPAAITVAVLLSGGLRRSPAGGEEPALASTGGRSAAARHGSSP